LQLFQPAPTYPNLPPCSCRRSHADVLLLASTALGAAMPPTRRRMSLTGLVELVLGLPLDKTQQCSSWGARPLLPLQLRYAAADAHALVAVYQALQGRRQGLETPFWLSQFSGGWWNFGEEALREAQREQRGD